MLQERYKIEFIKATVLLKSLQCDPDRLDIILEIHKIIIRSITKQEKLISLDKKGGKRLDFYRNNKKPDKKKSTDIKIMIKRIRTRIKQRKHIIFLFKCYGDGIANIYQSMYSLKHLYYGSRYQIKEDAGFISGKSGFLREWKVFLTGLKYNVPVVMSDTTNIIRNGDVCALAGKDPVPIEVKLTKHVNPNARFQRQKTHIAEIASFFKNDYSQQFRGGFDTYRTPLAYKEIDYINEINYLADICKSEHYSYKEVEQGVIYFCINGNLSESAHLTAMNMMKDLSNESTLIIDTNPSESWADAYPFTLSLTTHNLLKFIFNDLYIFIMIDLEVVRSLFLNNKIHAVFLMDGVSSMQICIDPKDLLKGVYRISESNFLRNAISFLSVKVFVDECSKYLSEDALSPTNISEHTYERLLKTGQVVEEYTIKEWSEIKDCLKDPVSDC